MGPQGNFYDEIADYDFNGDPFFEEDIAIDQIFYDDMVGLSCDLSGDVTVTLLENSESFQEMENFCGGEGQYPYYC